MAPARRIFFVAFHALERCGTHAGDHLRTNLRLHSFSEAGARLLLVSRPGSGGGVFADAVAEDSDESDERSCQPAVAARGSIFNRGGLNVRATLSGLPFARLLRFPWLL